MKLCNATASWIGLFLVVLSRLTLADDPPVPPKGIPTPAPVERPAAAPKEATPAPPGVPTPARPAGASASSEGVLTPKLQPQSVTVILINGTTMVGTIGEADQWTMKTSFGTA